MNIKIMIQVFIFVIFIVGIHRYIIEKSKKCDNKACACPVRDSLAEGYIVVGILSLTALVLFILVELFIQ